MGAATGVDVTLVTQRRVTWMSRWRYCGRQIPLGCTASGCGRRLLNLPLVRTLHALRTVCPVADRRVRVAGVRVVIVILMPCSVYAVITESSLRMNTAAVVAMSVREREPAAIERCQGG